MLSINVTVTGLDETQAKLGALSESFKDFTNALNLLGKQLIMFYSQTVFVGQGSPIGKRWAPLKASTLVEKDKHWPGRGPLVRTGAMQGGFYSEATTDTLFIGNNVSYFPYQQLGTAGGGELNNARVAVTRTLLGVGGGGHIGRGHNIPARPMLGIGPRVETMIKTVIEEDIRAKIAAL